MGLFVRCFPYYVKKKFRRFIKSASFPGGLTARFECRYCDKYYSFSMEDLSIPSIIRMRRVKACPNCAGKIQLADIREN